MRSLAYFASLLGLVALCMRVDAAPYDGSYMPPSLQESNNQEAEDDRVYAYREVDVKAKITNRMEHLPEPGKDCPSHAGLVRLKVILHKSGRVAEVMLIKGMGCSYDEAAVEAARKFKFTPAVKGGKRVSQYQIFEYQYRGI